MTCGKESEKRSYKSGRISRRRVLGSGAAILGSTGIAGCIGGDGGGGGSNFKVGAVLPLSQGWKPWGQPILNSAKIGQQRINNDGGLAGSEVEILVEDSEASPDTATEKTNKLINQDNVDMILGPVTSASLNAMSPILKRNRVPAFYSVGYEGAAGDYYCNEWLFKFAEVPAQQINPLIPWLIENHGESFHLIGTDYIWPRTTNELVRSRVDENGGSVLGETYVPFGTTDFTSIISDIEDQDPDILFMTLTGGEAINMSKQMANFGVRDQWKEVGLAHIKPVVEGLPDEAATGLLNCLDYIPSLDNEVNNEFLSDYEEQFGEGPSVTSQGVYAFMAMQMLDKAVANTGSATAEDIQAGMADVTVTSPMGERSIVHDHQANHACSVAEVDEDKNWNQVTQFDEVMPEQTCGF